MLCSHHSVGQAFYTVFRSEYFILDQLISCDNALLEFLDFFPVFLIVPEEIHDDFFIPYLLVPPMSSFCNSELEDIFGSFLGRVLAPSSE